MSVLLAVLMTLPPITHLIGTTPEGHVVAMARNTALVIDVPRERVLRRVLTTVGYLRASALRPDGRMALLAGENGIERIDLKTGKHSHLLPDQTRVRSLVYAPDGQTFVSHGGGTHLRRAHDGQSLWGRDAMRGALAVDISSEGVVAWVDREALRLRRLDGTLVPAPLRVARYGRLLKFSPDGQSLAWIRRTERRASADSKAAIVISRLDGSAPARERWVQRPSQVLWLNDSRLAVLERNKRPSIWDLETEQWHTGPEVDDVIAHGPNALYVKDADGLRIWRPSAPAHRVEKMHDAPIDHLVGDRRDALLTVAHDGTAALLDRQTVMVRTRWALHDGPALKPVRTRCTEPGFATAGADGRVWQVSTQGEPPWLLKTLPGPVKHLVPMTDCLLAAATDRVVVIVDLLTRREVARRTVARDIDGLWATVHPRAPLRACGMSPPVYRPAALRVSMDASQLDPLRRSQDLLWSIEGWQPRPAMTLLTPRPQPLALGRDVQVDQNRSDTLVFSDRPALRLPGAVWTGLLRGVGDAVIATTAEGQVVVVERGETLESAAPEPMVYVTRKVPKPRVRFLSPDRVFLSLHDTAGVHVETGQPFGPWADRRRPIHNLLRSPDGRHEVVRAYPRQGAHIATAEGQVIARPKRWKTGTRPALVWLDSKRILEFQEATASVVGLDGTVISSLPVPPRASMHDRLAISPDWTRVFGVLDDGTVWTTTLQSADLQQREARRGRPVEHTSISPNGRRAVVYHNGGRSTVYALPELTPVGQRRGLEVVIGFADDDHLLVVQGGLWTVPIALEPRRGDRPRTSGELRVPAVDKAVLDPSGKRILIQRADCWQMLDRETFKPLWSRGHDGKRCH